mmetsp:Transcript_14406/g.36519  ORF Transcript_14406/g.36519 Transcript_14406/m.36519 type:complete len:211 (+) Transcript_14406:177-809(+)
MQQRTQSYDCRPSSTATIAHAKHLLTSNTSVPSSVRVRSELSISTQKELPSTSSARSVSSIFAGPRPPANPQRTPASGGGKGESTPVPIDSSKSTLTFGGVPFARIGSSSGSVCALRCRMNSTSGTALITASSLALAPGADTRDMSTPLMAVAFIWTRAKPSPRSSWRKVASSRRTSSTRVEHRCAARRTGASPDARLAAASRSTQAGEA